MQQSLIPIIILNWNGLQDTLECLASLQKQTYQNYLIYLVDNASAADNQTALKETFQNNPKVKLIFNEENIGFARGNNQILAEHILPNSDFTYAVLLNNDTTVEADWLENLVNTAKEKKADLIACKMVDYYEREKMDNAGHLMLNTGEIIPVGHGESVQLHKELVENIGPCAGAVLYSTKMLRDIGIFDSHFTTGYEDAELGLRAVVAGYKSYFDPSAVVYHKMGQSIKKIFNYDYSLSIQQHILYTYFKLMPLGVILLTVPSFLVKYSAMFVIDVLFWRPKFLKIMFESIGGTFKNRKEILAARREFFKERNTLSTFAVLKKQTFFLWFDIKRFYKYFIQNKPSAFDTYGKVESTSLDKS